MNDIDDFIPRLVQQLEHSLRKMKFAGRHDEEYVDEYMAKMILGVDCFNYSYRVKLLANDMVQFSQLQFPRQSLKVDQVIARSELPDWADELVCVLAICDTGIPIPNVGVKLEDDVYYITKGHEYADTGTN